jgi:DNA-binding protein H-NS
MARRSTLRIIDAEPAKEQPAAAYDVTPPLQHVNTPPLFDFSGCSFSELADIHTAVTAEMESRRASELAALRAEIEHRAAALGVPVNTLFVPPPRVTRPIKFRDPESGRGWRGHGRPPAWLKAKIAAGEKLEAFRV